jgi:hypothetical protein
MADFGSISIPSCIALAIKCFDVTSSLLGLLCVQCCSNFNGPDTFYTRFKQIATPFNANYVESDAYLCSCIVLKPEEEPPCQSRCH